MTIGIPKALLYYKYHILWENFFSYLNINTVTSPSTNKEILDVGIKNSIDEACLSLKIYLGHIKYLCGKCDYVLIPRIVSLNKNEKLCTNFSALYDIVKNTYKVKILNYNIDVDKNYDELYAFVSMARELGISRYKAVKAYIYAKEKEKEDETAKIIKQESLIKTNKLKILIAGHDYNIYDEFLGKTIIYYLKKMDVVPITSDICKKTYTDFDYKMISKDLYWTYNKEILSSINHYLKEVDGIILISTFPCGPDSLSNEIVVRKIKNKPIITIIIDELNNSSGLITRLESFVDILKERKGMNLYEQ